MIATPVSESSWPVGSSASSTAAGWPARGRSPPAAARRPTARTGRWRTRPPRPTSSSRCATRASRSARPASDEPQRAPPRSPPRTGTAPGRSPGTRTRPWSGGPPRAAGPAGCRDLHAVQQDRARGGPVEAAEEVEQRGLAAAATGRGRASEPTARHAQVDAAQRVHDRVTGRVVADQAASFDDDARRCRPGVRTARLGAWVVGPVIGRLRLSSSRGDRRSGQTPTWSSSRRSRTRSLQAERLDVGPRQLDAAGPVEERELLAHPAVLAVVAVLRSADRLGAGAAVADGDRARHLLRHERVVGHDHDRGARSPR